MGRPYSGKRPTSSNDPILTIWGWVPRASNSAVGQKPFSPPRKDMPGILTVWGWTGRPGKGWRKHSKKARRDSILWWEFPTVWGVFAPAVMDHGGTPGYRDRWSHVLCLRDDPPPRRFFRTRG